MPESGRGRVQSTEPSGKIRSLPAWREAPFPHPGVRDSPMRFASVGRVVGTTRDSAAIGQTAYCGRTTDD